MSKNITFDGNKYPIHAAAIERQHLEIERLLNIYIIREDAKNGNKNCLVNKYDVDECLEYGVTALRIAAQHGDHFSTAALIRSGADPNKADETGCTPLISACCNGHIKIAIALIKAGANVNQAMDGGITPLFTASEYGHESIVRCLMNSGADPNQPIDSGFAPIYIAHRNEHYEIVQLLMRGGADPLVAFSTPSSSLQIIQDYNPTKANESGASSSEEEAPYNEKAINNSDYMNKLIEEFIDLAEDPSCDSSLDSSIERLVWRINDVKLDSLDSSSEDDFIII